MRGGLQTFFWALGGAVRFFILALGGSYNFLMVIFFILKTHGLFVSNVLFLYFSYCVTPLFGLGIFHSVHWQPQQAAAHSSNRLIWGLYLINYYRSIQCSHLAYILFLNGYRLQRKRERVKPSGHFIYLCIMQIEQITPCSLACVSLAVTCIDT